jgi:hypothetical protein
VQQRRDELKTLFRETAQNIFTIVKLADVRDACSTIVRRFDAGLKRNSAWAKRSLPLYQCLRALLTVPIWTVWKSPLRALPNRRAVHPR